MRSWESTLPSAREAPYPHLGRPPTPSLPALHSTTDPSCPPAPLCTHSALPAQATPWDVILAEEMHFCACGPTQALTGSI